MSASMDRATAGSLAAGSAWARLPATVPRWRMVGWATSSSASRSSGACWATSVDASAAASRRRAPRRAPAPPQPGAAPDGQPAVVPPDVVELRDRVHVDQVGRLREAEVHERDQALPTCEDAALVLELAQDADHFAHRARCVIGEGRWF